MESRIGTEADPYSNADCETHSLWAISQAHDRSPEFSTYFSDAHTRVTSPAIVPQLWPLNSFDSGRTASVRVSDSAIGLFSA